MSPQCCLLSLLFVLLAIRQPYLLGPSSTILSVSQSSNTSMSIHVIWRASNSRLCATAMSFLPPVFVMASRGILHLESRLEGRLIVAVVMPTSCVELFWKPIHRLIGVMRELGWTRRCVMGPYPFLYRRKLPSYGSLSAVFCRCFFSLYFVDHFGCRVRARIQNHLRLHTCQLVFRWHIVGVFDSLPGKLSEYYILAWNHWRE